MTALEVKVAICDVAAPNIDDNFRGKGSNL